MLSGGAKVGEQRPLALAAVQRARPVPKQQSDLSHPSGPDRTGLLETLGQRYQVTLC
jgi:hypothetical protein